jgi:molybdopterin synthase catalytic subunit
LSGGYGGRLIACRRAQACAWAIDELKATVPIWKKEVYEGGEVWKENAEAREALLAARRGA